MMIKRKKALLIASVASMHDNFNRENIDILLSMGFDITVASNFHTVEDINSQEKIDGFVKEMQTKGVHVVQIDFTRKVRNPGQQVKSVIQVKKLLSQGFDIVHCHAPICAAVTRMEYRKYRKKHGGKLIYTAHGFHFYKGASIQNWLFYYPVEWLCSWWTDMLITINREDYKCAKKFHAKKVVYVQGVGVDLGKFNNDQSNKDNKRKELGLEKSDIMLLSVGELSKRKNHEVVIRALYELNNPNVKYFICGQGELEGYLKHLIRRLGLKNQVELLGYRTDISEMCQAADIFVFPSLQEGLPVALMEAIASKVPVICSRIRGNTDLVMDEKFLFNAKDVQSLLSVLKATVTTRKELHETMKKYVCRNFEHLKGYSLSNVSEKMLSLYQNVIDMDSNVI